jgi:hypothetical protein
LPSRLACSFWKGDSLAQSGPNLRNKEYKYNHQLHSSHPSSTVNDVLSSLHDKRNEYPCKNQDLGRICILPSLSIVPLVQLAAMGPYDGGFTATCGLPSQSPESGQALSAENRRDANYPESHAVFVVRFHAFVLSLPASP